ncbi:hypothetical protein [Amycolatopsis rifamycinica]|nr:hypothetical protein [Amycolatopsis rifamycinica]
MIAAFIDVSCHVRHALPGGFDHYDRQRTLSAGSTARPSWHNPATF